MKCEDLRAALELLSGCEGTEFGARVKTHCLYPSYTQVSVFVAKLGDGFHVHDGGEAFREAWLHGRDEALIMACLKREAGHHHLALAGNSLVTEALDMNWLPSAILAVANASGAAASAAVAKMRAAVEDLLVERIHEKLRDGFGKNKIARDYSLRGRSGKEYSFDFALFDQGDSQIIIDAVSPHHASISAKYVAFSDAVSVSDGIGLHKFAVYDRPLSRDDVSLMQQVAKIVPLNSMVEGSKRLLHG